MAMLPIFLIGVAIGALLTYLLLSYKKESPSEVKFRMQEATIISLKEDIKILEESNEKLQSVIDDFKKEFKKE